ncbi:MAG TPA: MBL fold metallo-hydrolase [Acidobacteriota bacterium]|nr:MBL fold metallo-hydrolase [Acidobacteriota bacterium]
MGIIFAIVHLAALLVVLPVQAAESAIGAASPQQQRVTLKWLGTAGWEIQIAQTKILIDPFLTRKQAVAAEEWKTDKAAVLNVISGADYIFAGHSHVDHIGDIPFIAKRFGAKVIGSRTTVNLCLSAGVDKAQLTTISGGEKLDFKDFSVQVIESQHSVVTRGGQKRQPRSAEITKPLTGPILGKHFVEGGSYLYYFTFGKIRLLDQSSGNFIEENLRGLEPDVAILAENSNYDWDEAIKILRPKTVIVHHYDDWHVPFSGGMTAAARRRAQRLEQQVKSVDRNIKVIIPEFLRTITLE